MVYRTLAGLALLGLTASAASAAERPVVVELFTSQGCSSCPPANAYLNELARGRTDVLPLAFHVTYWDRLGWKDPFSLPEATSRQDTYGHRFGDGKKLILGVAEDAPDAFSDRLGYRLLLRPRRRGQR